MVSTGHPANCSAVVLGTLRPKKGPQSFYAVELWEPGRSDSDWQGTRAPKAFAGVKLRVPGTARYSLDFGFPRQLRSSSEGGRVPTAITE